MDLKRIEEQKIQVKSRMESLMFEINKLRHIKRHLEFMEKWEREDPTGSVLQDEIRKGAVMENEGKILRHPR